MKHMERKLLPIGIDDYKKLIDENYYYVDKTLMIKELIDNLALVNLFTRPRRFGKTLNLSMLRYFFEQPADGNSNAYLFRDKKIMAEEKKYTEYQEQYPVIHLSLKSGKQPNFELAFKVLKKEIQQEFDRHRYVIDSLESIRQKIFLQILNDTADKSEWYQAVAFLSRCLEEYHRQKVIILLDEYDVPLENAYYCGFYKEMTDFIRSLFESALKSNLSLRFAVITGCLRISRESIFTGLNNLDIISILGTVYNEHFGFTQVEYWSNTSSNLIIKDLLSKSTDQMRDELEILLQDGTIEKTVHEDITYQDIYESEENLWNFLFFTGYLKAVDVKMVGDDRTVVLKIPNKEIKKIYRQQIILWSRNTLRARDLTGLFQAVLSGDADGLQKELSGLLITSVSYMDNAEDFYHGFLLGILMNLEGYKVTSNRESGDGRYDLCIVSRNGLETPVILEFKIAKNRRMLESAAEAALRQITDQRYDAPLEEDGYEKCIHIGIGFCKKMCRVKSGIVDLNPKS